ncbi:Unknown protein, partial [Striga hermonthica]
VVASCFGLRAEVEVAARRSEDGRRWSQLEARVAGSVGFAEESSLWRSELVELSSWRRRVRERLVRVVRRRNLKLGAQSRRNLLADGSSRRGGEGGDG